MKKNLSLYDQIDAAKKEVSTWPDSIKSALVINQSEFFRNSQEEKSQPENIKASSREPRTKS